MAWDPTIPGDNDAWDDAAGFIRANWAYMETIWGTDLVAGQNVVNVTSAPYNAKGDGSTDDTAAIQAAIDSLKFGVSSNRAGSVRGGIVYLPASTTHYVISAPLLLYSGIRLIGAGKAATMIKTTGFSGAYMVGMQNSGDGSVRCEESGVNDIGFFPPAGVWSIKGVTAGPINLFFKEIGIYGSLGFDFSGTTQFTTITDIYSTDCDTIVKLSGNKNVLQRINKESGAGTEVATYPAYIDISDCDQLVMRDCLMEGDADAGRIAIKLEDCSNIVIENNWLEFTSPGIESSITAINCVSVFLNNRNLRLTGELGQKYNFTACNPVFIDYVNLNGTDRPLSDSIIADSDSFVYIDTMFSRQNQDLLDNDNISIKNTIYPDDSQIGSSQNSVLPYDYSQNLLVNGSFEDGEQGWTNVTGVFTSSASTFNHGLQGEVTVAGVGSGVIKQSVDIVIPTGMEDRTYTFSWAARVVNSGSIRPFLSMAASGIGSDSTSKADCTQTSAEWGVYSFTFQPKKSGALTIGLIMNNEFVASVDAIFYIDCMTLNIGKVGTLDAAYDIHAKEISLLSTTIVPLNANGDTVLYTVPTGKTLILDHATLVGGADAGTSDISIGQNGAETDFVGVTNLDNLNAASDSVLLAPVPSATPATLKAYAATTVIEAQVANQAGGATNTLFLYGTLY